MPVPPNTSQGTAIELGPLPNTIAQQVDFAGTTYTVWYKYTAQPGDSVVGVWAFGDLVTYKPTTDIITTDPNFPGEGPAVNVPFQLPVTPGQVYFFEIIPNGGNPAPANLVISGLKAPTLTAPAGSILIMDDTSLFPGALLSAGNGSVLRFAPAPTFPASEVGDILNTGEFCGYDSGTNTLVFFDPHLKLVASIGAGNQAGPITTNTTSNFYVGDQNQVLKVYSKVGAVLKTITLTTTGLEYMGVDNGETILYYTGVFANFGAVKRWDLVNGVALSNLAGAIASFSTQDIVVLADGTVLVMYTGSTTQKVLHYSAAGAVLNTYLFTEADDSLQRICRAIDDPNSFWSFQHLAGGNVGISRFRNVHVSDGVYLSSFDAVEYERGLMFRPPTASPLALFGHSQSCPIAITRAAVPLSLCF